MNIMTSPRGPYNGSSDSFLQVSVSDSNARIESIIQAIEGNIKDNQEIIARQKEQVYKMASDYLCVRDHSIEIANIKADVARREILLEAYNHCLRIVKGEQKI